MPLGYVKDIITYINFVVDGVEDKHGSTGVCFTAAYSDIEEKRANKLGVACISEKWIEVTQLN